MKLLILFTLISFATLSQESMKFTADKKLHFLAGAGVGYVVSDIAYKSDRFNDREAIVLGVFTSYVVGAGKEVYDLYSKNGTASLQDLTYTFYGGVIGTLASYGINKLIDHRNKKRKLRLKL